MLTSYLSAGLLSIFKTCRSEIVDEQAKGLQRLTIIADPK